METQAYVIRIRVMEYDTGVTLKRKRFIKILSL